jgi:hypothetical protein
MLNISEDTRKELAELKILIEKNLFLEEKPPRCKFCKDILIRDSSKPFFFNKGYCNKWCKDEDTKIIDKRCQVCNGLVFPPSRKDGSSSGVYAKRCVECRIKK